MKEKKVGFFDTIKKLNSKTFAALYQMSTAGKLSEKKLLKADRRLLQRLFNAASSGRSVQTADILKHELSPVPLSLAKPGGEMNTTAKSDLLSLLTTAQEIAVPAEVPKTDLTTCVLIDGHALIQALGKPQGCTTFSDYATVFARSVLKHIDHNTTRVDVTFDRYLGGQSIKSSTRSKRKGKRRPVRKLTQTPDIPLPQVWDQFIALEDNKADLPAFLSAELLREAESMPDCEIIAGGGFPDSASAKSSKREVANLCANHEEVDSRLIVHAKNAIACNFKRIVVMCRDTDVLLLLLYHIGRTDVEVWTVSGTAKQKKCYPVHAIASKLDDDVLNNILGFHALTGCDTTSSYSGISKTTCWKQYLKAPRLLQYVGRGIRANEIEEFICRLYCSSSEFEEHANVDSLRFNLFSKARKGLELLPPTKDALDLHSKRAEYQAKIWLNASSSEMEIEPAADTGGWKSGEKGLEIVWTRLPAVPTACLELTTRGCKTKCSTARCKCYTVGQICMYECACDAIGCANPVGLQAALEAIEYAESVEFPVDIVPQ